MSRTASDEIKEILSTTLDDSIIEAYITASNITITDLLGGTTLSDAQLKEIERWYACHLIAATRERQYSKEQIGQVSVTYEGKTGLGLDSTMYGQQCKILDTSGILAKASLGLRKATVYAVPNFDDEDD